MATAQDRLKGLKVSVNGSPLIAATESAHDPDREHEDDDIEF